MRLIKFDHEPTDNEIIEKYPPAEGKSANVFQLKDGSFAVFIFD